MNLSEPRMGTVRSHFGEQPLEIDGAGAVARAIRERHTVRIPVVDAGSLLVVPLQVRERVIGALAISRHGPAPRDVHCASLLVLVKHRQRRRD